MKHKNKNKVIASWIFGLVVMTGTYNAVVINSESSISGEGMYGKRLDEMYGVVVPGRNIAGSGHWKKISPNRNVDKKIEHKAEVKIAAQTSASFPTPAVEEETTLQTELNLSLVEVMNEKKWQTGIPAGQFSGTLSANNGVIEEMNVALPNGEGFSVAFSEMTGNVFEYDINGEVYSGMMYQVDQNGFMVTLTNGPLEGTRMRFSSQNPADQQFQTQEVLAENNISNGSFGEIQPETMIPNDQNVQQEALQAHSFNMDHTEAM